MTQMPETLTLEQVEYLRRTLPQKSMSDLMPKVNVDTDVKGVIGVLSQEQFEKERQLENDNQAERVRQHRNQMLFQCDWTQAKDIP